MHLALQPCSSSLILLFTTWAVMRDRVERGPQGSGKRAWISACLASPPSPTLAGPPYSCFPLPPPSQGIAAALDSLERSPSPPASRFPSPHPTVAQLLGAPSKHMFVWNRLSLWSLILREGAVVWRNCSQRLVVGVSYFPEHNLQSKNKPSGKPPNVLMQKRSRGSLGRPVWNHKMGAVS